LWYDLEKLPSQTHLGPSPRNRWQLLFKELCPLELLKTSLHNLKLARNRQYLKMVSLHSPRLMCYFLSWKYFEWIIKTIILFITSQHTVCSHFWYTVLSAWLLIDSVLVMPVIHATVRRPINYLLTRTPHLASSTARAFVIDVTAPLIQTKLDKSTQSKYL